MSESKTLLITGMHRSGTSLCARWFDQMGLHLGNNLMINNDRSNPDGYYEDYDFIKFHNEILTRNSVPYFVNKKDNLIIEDKDRIKARELVSNKKKENNQWGWKDPRSSIFISLWTEVIPNLNKLILYRSFQNTVDSLLRREFMTVRKWKRIPTLINLVKRNEIKDMQEKYLASWIMHYSELLNHYNKNKDMVISTNNLKSKDKEIVSTFQEYGFDLKYKPIVELIRKDKMKRELSFYKQGLFPGLEKDAKKIMHQLQMLDN